MSDPLPRSRLSPLSAIWTSVAVAVLFLALGLAYTFPMILDPATANRLDSPDAVLNAWILCWDLDQLVAGNLDVFDAGIFFPEPNTLAYSENLLTAALLVLPVRVFTDDPVLLYNAALLLILAANGVAGYWLGCEFGRSKASGITTGILIGLASFHWAHIPHLQLQILFPLALAFLYARRLRDRPGALPAAALALSVAACLGASGYYAAFLATALPVFVVVDVLGIERRRRLPVIGHFAATAALATTLSLPLLLPYGAKRDAGYGRSLGTARAHSAEPIAYVTSAARLHFFLPGHETGQEPFFPGFAATALAAAALAGAASNRLSRRDVVPWVAVAVLGVAISLGPPFGVFSLLHELGPYQALRVPARAGVLFLVAAAVLAGMGVARARPRALRLLLPALVAAECYAGPLPWRMEAPAVPPIYAALQELDEPGALVELPMPPAESFQDNARYVYRAIFHRRPLVNGYSGFVPDSYVRTRRLLMSGRFAEGLDLVAKQGVRFLIVHGGRLGPRMSRRIASAERAGRLRLVDRVGLDRLYRIEAE